MPLKILLADDSMTAQKMGKEILSAAGYEVIAVSNGAVAAKKLADKPDIAILDVFMPGYTGLELCEKIRASMDIAKTPVLLTVGKMEPFRAEDGQKVKADGVIVKPFEATDLLAAVQKLAEKIAADAKPQPKSGAYEKTMVFKSPQIVEEFKDESVSDWKGEADKADAESAYPRPMQMSSEAGSAPAFGADLMGDSAPAFAEESSSYSPSGAYAEPASDYSAAPPTFEVMVPHQETSLPSVPFDENIAFAQRLLPSDESPRKKRTTAEIEAGAAIAAAAANAPEEAPVESPSLESLLERTSEPSGNITTLTPEMEFTSAPQALEIAVTPDPGLDRGEGAYSGHGAPGQDPALETDATQMVSQFPTMFGTSEPDEGIEVSESAATSSEANFDAEVSSAMSGYDTGSALNDEAEAATSAPEAAAASEPEAASMEPHYEDTQKIEAPVELVDEINPSQEPPQGMHNAEMAEQMQAASADLPAAQEEQGKAPPTAEMQSGQAQPSVPGPDSELASALAAAVGSDVSQPATSEAPAAIGDETTSRVVTRVLERMLPSIMAEVAREMEAAKKK